MPYLAICTLDVEGQKHHLAAGPQGGTCRMDKVPKGPLSAAGAAEPKLLVRKLEPCLKGKSESVYHNPL